jgi:hemerythrin
MPLFQWTSQYEVYVPELDAEHRAMFLAGAELERAAAAQAPSTRTREIVRALICDAEDHFAHEERLMSAARYPGLEWHKKQHDGARRKLKQFAKRIEAGDTEAPGELTQYLRRWLKDHLAVTDRLMTASLRNVMRQRAVAS